MDWSDDEFEIFLRQFRPSAPKALSIRRHRKVVLGAAAVSLVAATIPVWMALRRPMIEAVAPRGASNPSAPASASDTVAPSGRPYTVGTPSRAGNRRVKVDELARPPLKVADAPPRYPKDAQAAGIQGVVILGIVIGEDGSVIEVEVLRSIPGLDQAAIDAVLQWQYEATLLNGEPVEVEMNVTINFTLQ